MNNPKKLMCEIAVLYYQKKYTQQEIAAMLNLSRQTVSKFINDAINEKVVETVIHDPEEDCGKLEKAIREKFGIKDAVVCSVVSKEESVRQLIAVRRGIKYLAPILKKGNQKIAVSWGRTVQQFIEELEPMDSENNLVFPLFGATDNVQSCFSSNELARTLADKISADVKNAWFPYLPHNKEDTVLFKNTEYYRSMARLWQEIDLAIIGIGNTAVLELFKQTFPCEQSGDFAVGDVATHFFTSEGETVPLYDDSLCASLENLKNAKKTVAIACGDCKAIAIQGALKTKAIDVLITDEYTAKKVLAI